MKEAIEALREGLSKEKIDRAVKSVKEELDKRDFNQMVDGIKTQDITITSESIETPTVTLTIDQGKTFVLPKDFEADLTAPSIFQDITREMYNLYVAKNADYGSSVSDTYNKYGMVSYLVRMEDKLNRARTLVQKGDQKVSDEKLRDTLVDLANYAILAVMELEGDK